MSPLSSRSWAPTLNALFAGLGRIPSLPLGANSPFSAREGVDVGPWNPPGTMFHASGAWNECGRLPPQLLLPVAGGVSLGGVSLGVDVVENS